MNEPYTYCKRCGYGNTFKDDDISIDKQNAVYSAACSNCIAIIVVKPYLGEPTEHFIPELKFDR